MKKILFASIVLLTFVLSAIPSTYADNREASFMPQSLKISEEEQINYWLFTPKNASKDMPLIVSLHGGSGRGDDINTLTSSGFCQLVYEKKFDNVPAYMIFPQVSSKYKSWNDIKRYVKQLIEYTAKKYAIDVNKISLTGHSMGGTGTYSIAAAYPEIFSCIAPMSGSIDCTDENITALSSMPVWAFAGTADTVVLPESSVNFVNALSNAGANAKITLFDGAEHRDIPELAYLDDSINVVDWLVRNSKENAIIGYSLNIITANVRERGDYIVIIADYNGDGKLADVRFIDKNFLCGINTIPAPDNIALETNDKIMIWRSAESLYPACNTYIIQ